MNRFQGAGKSMAKRNTATWGTGGGASTTAASRARRAAGGTRTSACRNRSHSPRAAAARGEWLLFLHADVRVPPAARRALLAAVVDAPPPVPQVAVFRFAIDLPAPWKRFLELGQGLRQRLDRLPYGH